MTLEDAIDLIERGSTNLLIFEANREADATGDMALLAESVGLFEGDAFRTLNQAMDYLISADPPPGEGMRFAAALFLLHRAVHRYRDGLDGGFGIHPKLSNREVVWSVAELLRECLPENSENPSAEKKESDSPVVNGTV